MERQYANEQLRKGQAEPVQVVEWLQRVETDGSCGHAHFPLGEFVHDLKRLEDEVLASYPQEERHLYVVGLFRSSTLDKISGQLFRVKPPQMDAFVEDIGLAAEADRAATERRADHQTTAHVAKTLKSEPRLTIERYDEVLADFPNRAAVERLLTAPTRYQQVVTVRGGHQLSPIDFKLTRLPSDRQHAVVAEVVAVNDITCTATVRIRDFLVSPGCSVKSALRGRATPLKLHGNRPDERALMLLAQTSGTPILLDLTADVGIGRYNDLQRSLRLIRVPPIEMQPERLRMARETPPAIYHQLPMFDDTAIGLPAPPPDMR